MPIDKFGRVIVNPSVPLGLDDFAAMYTSGGRTPQENASQLWFKAPREGQSYINEQWSGLNTGMSPEQYFSDPSRVAAILASSSPSENGGTAVRGPHIAQAAVDPLGRIPVSPGATGTEQWPMYRNETMRNMAVDLGMDRRLEYLTPDRMMAATAAHLSTVPKDHLLDDPELQKLLKVDPAKAHFIYNKLTGGGDYAKDTNEREQRAYARGEKLDQREYNKGEELEQRKYSQEQLAEHRLWQAKEIEKSHAYSQGQRKEEREYMENKAAQAAIASSIRRPYDQARDWAEREIQRGAKINPVTGKWMLWQNVEPEPGSVDTRPQRRMVEATPEQQLHLTQHYREYVGADLPLNRRENYAPILEREYAMSPEQQAYVQSRIAKYKQDNGYEPNASTRQHFLIEAEQAHNPTTSIFHKLGTSILSGAVAQPYKWTPEEAAAFMAAPPEQAYGF